MNRTLFFINKGKSRLKKIAYRLEDKQRLVLKGWLFQFINASLGVRGDSENPFLLGMRKTFWNQTGDGCTTPRVLLKSMLTTLVFFR